MYRVVRRTGDIFGDEPHVCEFVCDTSDDVVTLPTSVKEGTGGKSKYDNQKCSAGSSATIATSSGSNSYILNNSDEWIAQSSGGSSGESIGGIYPLGEDGMPYGDVIIPEGVKSISSISGANDRKSCFFANVNVNTVKIPSSMEILGDYGFSYSSLTDVIFGKNSNVTEIRTNCFYECNNLKSISVPEKVSYIGRYAFYGNDSLEHISFKSDLTMDANAFASCSKLSIINWGNGRVIIGDNSFYKCVSLSNLVISANVVSLGNQYTFADCTALTKVIFEEGSPITALPSNAFYGCSSLNEIVLPKNLRTIGNNCFERCSLSTIVIPSGVTTIGRSAFYSCKKLTSITLPNTITSMDITPASSYNTFSECTALETVNLEENFNCSINLHYTSVLTNAAEMLTKLKDLTGETAKTITFAKAVYDTLTADELAVATNKNWNVVSYGS